MAVKPFHLFFATFLLIFVLQPLVIKSLKLESIQNLQQAQKGDIINGVNQIKKYLKTYGYYPHNIKHTLDNKFDNSLESALKAYQKYTHLNVTGKIDYDTIEAMMTPRCGVPDNHLVSNYNFPGLKWNKYDLTYSVKNDVNVFSETEMTPTLNNIFKSWADVSPFKFSKAAQGSQGDLKIGFFPTNHGDGFPFSKRTWAHAFYPQQRSYTGKLHFNADATKKWSFNPPADDYVDVESVALHELGHNLGLNHSQYSSAVMYAYFNGGKFTKRVLTNDDKDGLKALYGYTRP